MHARAAGREWGKERKRVCKRLKVCKTSLLSCSPSLCHMIIAKFLHQSARLYKVLFFLESGIIINDPADIPSLPF